MFKRAIIIAEMSKSIKCDFSRRLYLIFSSLLPLKALFFCSVRSIILFSTEKTFASTWDRTGVLQIIHLWALSKAVT